MVYHLKQDYCSIICSKRYSMCQKKVSCVSVLEKGLLPFLHESFTTKITGSCRTTTPNMYVSHCAMTFMEQHGCELVVHSSQVS